MTLKCKICGKRTITVDFLDKSVNLHKQKSYLCSFRVFLLSPNNRV